ncbi:hypothetical protein CHUAL_008921 [Chamberlinius hualienensis]
MGKNKNRGKVIVVENKTSVARNNNNKKKSKPTTQFASPYELTWPKIAGNDQEFIRQRLQSTLSSLPLARWKGPLPTSEGPFNDLKSKNERKKLLCKEHWEKGKQFRKHFSFGISKVIRDLEKDELAVVLVAKDVQPEVLIEPLLTMCCSRSIHAGAVNLLGTTIKTSLNFNSCSAFGIKKSALSLDPTDIIYKLYEDVKDKLPDLPELLDLSDEAELQPKVPQRQTDRQKHPEPVINKDFSYLYIRKSDITGGDSTADLIPFKCKPSLDFMSLNSQQAPEAASAPTSSTNRKRGSYQGLKLKKINPKKFKQ